MSGRACFDDKKGGRLGQLCNVKSFCVVSRLDIIVLALARPPDPANLASSYLKAETSLVLLMKKTSLIPTCCCVLFFLVFLDVLVCWRCSPHACVYSFS